tara:strand:+ start:13503 stop:14435 length:933 start_codon:yes stop_codon:yes gene_type:complete
LKYPLILLKKESDMKLWRFVLVVCFLATACGGGGDVPTPDPVVETPDYEACLPEVGESTLEVVTWNVENFPMHANTASAVKQIIEDTDVDVIALQEITSKSEFNALVDGLDGWSGHVEDYAGSQWVGYMYKTSEITVLTQPENLFAESSNDDYNFAFTSARRPLYMKFQHINGLTVNIINVHMKCCSGSEDRRRSGAVLLKDYIDTNLPNENVILLGDFNDEIVDQADNVFQNFIDDNANYKFTTMPIAQGASSGWSYPSWPSQIDQILITNELFTKATETLVLKLDNCQTTFGSQVSDHRPVMIRLNNN